MAGSVRYTVRHRLSRLLGDLVVLSTATSDSATTVTDTVELVNYADDRLIGAYLNIYSATTAKGLERRITDNVQSTGVVTMPTGTDPTGTVLYEIHRSWRVSEYNAAINQAITDVRGDGRAFTTLISDTSITMTDGGTSTDYYIDLPSGFRSIHRGLIQVEGPTASIYDEQPLRYGVDWTFEKKTAETSSAAPVWQIVINRSAYVPIASRQLRLQGAGSQEEMDDDDTDILYDHLEPFVIQRAAYYLLQSRTRSGTPQSQANAKRAEQHWRESESARTRFDYSPPPGSARVPY